MSDVPSNLIPTRVTQLPVAPVASEDSLMMIIYQGNNYQIRVGDLLSVAGVPTSRAVLAGTGLTGGGQLSSNVTLSVAPGGIGPTQLSNTGVSAGVYGSATNIPVFTVDAQGRVTAATTIPAEISGYVPTTRQVIAGTGLNGGGALNANVTLNANLADTAPLSGFQSGVAGVSTNIARADHKHPAVDLSNDDEVDNILGLNNGGTARSIVPDNGAIIWSGADGLYVGPVGNIGQIMQSTGAGEYIWVNQSTLNVGQATNLNGGAANRIAYQTATGVTGFISAPTAPNTILYWNGSALVWGSVPGTGTVTSVGLALPADFDVTDSPVTSSGTLTATWVDQAANTVLAGPTTGVDDTPAFRALVNADLPASGVTANTYGSSTAIPVVTVNSKGIVTGVTTASIIGGLDYRGGWNAATNTPALASGVGTNGYYYVVTTAGNTNLDGISDWQVGDWAIFNGTIWQKIDQTNTVSSVNGQTGAVVLTAADVGAQPADAQLTDIAGLTPGDGSFIVGNGTNFITESGSTARTSLGAAASGANADITSMTGVTGGISSPDFIQFDATATVTDATAKLYYNNADMYDTLAFQMDGGVIQHIGQDSFYRVKLSAPATIGQVLMFTGTLGSSGGLQAAPATGLTPTQANYILGIAAQTGTTNDWITVYEFGEIRGLNTTGGAEAWAQGDILYYNPAVAGGLTKTKPNAPNAIATIAAVVSVGVSNGILYVRPTYGSVLGGTDGNVQFGTLNNGDVIVYDSTDQRWENVAQSSLVAGSATNVAGGAANKIVYNTASGVTSFVDAPTTANTVLSWSGSAFEWDVPGGDSVADGCIYPNNQTISNNYTFSSTQNGMSVGPITIASGATVTVSTGSRWVVL